MVFAQIRYVPHQRRLFWSRSIHTCPQELNQSGDPVPLIYAHYVLNFMFTSWADLSLSGVSSSQPTVHMVFDNTFKAAFEKGDLHMSKLEKKKNFVWIFLQKNVKVLFITGLTFQNVKKNYFMWQIFFSSPESLSCLGADLLWTTYSFSSFFFKHRLRF